MITQLGLDGAWNYGEIYSGSRHLATYSDGTTNFLHADWLGTKRVMTALNATVSETCTGFPFGDGVNCTGTNWTFNGFTDDIHDPETNLEHTLFRQYSGTEGRWLAPDPAGLAAADPSDLQSWNQYSYVENNATSAFDPLGLYCPTEFPDRGHIYCTPCNSIGIGCDLPWSIGGFGGGGFDPLHDSLGCVTSFAPGGPCIPIASLSDQLAALLAELPWNNPCAQSGPWSENPGCGGMGNGFQNTTPTPDPKCIVPVSQQTQTCKEIGKQFVRAYYCTNNSTCCTQAIRTVADEVNNRDTRHNPNHERAELPWMWGGSGTYLEICGDVGPPKPAPTPAPPPKKQSWWDWFKSWF